MKQGDQMLEGSCAWKRRLPMTVTGAEARKDCERAPWSQRAVCLCDSTRPPGPGDRGPWGGGESHGWKDVRAWEPRLWGRQSF